jgi:phosphate starvation-inducible PhoH-like protein
MSIWFAVSNIMSKKQKTDNSQYVHQDEKLKTKLQFRDKIRWTDKQKKFIELASNKETKIVFLTGVAGTSKTLVSIAAGLQLLNDKRIDELVYLRSIVESSSNSVGYLAGDLTTKLLPYMQPLADKLDELLTGNQADLLIKGGHVTGQSICYLRGLSWNAKFICADEAQNMTYKELFTLVTRVGQFSKLIITGDESQSDIGSKSGFSKMISALDDEESRVSGIHVFRFTEEDILRSELCRFITKKLKNVG